MINEQLFFDLIKVGIYSIECLSYIPSPIEWRRLYAIAKRQTLLAVCFNAIQRLYNEHPEQVQNIPIDVKLQWVGATVNIQKRNELLNQRVKELTNLFSEGGFSSIILKGQGIAQLYHNPLQRQSGDIDLWLDGSRKEQIAFIKHKGWKIGKMFVHHIDVDLFPETLVEIHQYPSYAYSPFRWMKYKRWFKEQAKKQFKKENPPLGFNYPSVEFNLVYCLLHIYRHVFHEGIGLRQLVDYYMVLNSLLSNEHDRKILQIEKERAINTLKIFGIERFAAAVMYVEQKIFGLSDDKLLCPIDEKAGNFLIQEIMSAGNFGKYDSRIRRSHIAKEVDLFFIHVFRMYRMIMLCPSEVFWAPIWKLAHCVWRKLYSIGINY